MIKRFFDFEVTPLWWLCVFGDMPDDMNLDENTKENFTIINSDMPNARDLLLQQLREKDVVNIGYNIKGYDLIIANAIYQGFTPEQVKIINDIIINPSTIYSTKEHLRLSPFSTKRLSGICYQDLMDDGDGSLKEKEAILGLNILESSVDFNKENLTDEDKADMTYYCKQDVYASMQFYKLVVRSYIENQLNIGHHFNISDDVCYKSTNAKLVALALGAKRSTFSDEDKVEIKLPDKIRDYCYDNMPNKLLEKILNSEESFKEILYENEVSFGDGGIHSTYIGKYAKPPCLYVEADEDYCLVNVDAASYYPSMMIQFNLLSRAVQNPKVFKDIFDERMRIKHKPDKTPEDDAAQKADKLILNTTYGASGNKYLDLYDPYMRTSVCRVGQIFLCSLACKIYKTIPNAKIIQTNTDGILCYLPKKDLDILKKLQDEWTAVSGINMELDNALKIWQRDVNNYIMLVEDHGKIKVKNKGKWLKTSYLNAGSVRTDAIDGYVSKKAAIKFLTEGEDIIENIKNNNNLIDFVMVCTKGPTFKGVIQKFSDGTEKQLFKSNRVIATTNDKKGLLYKYKIIKGETRYYKMPSIPEHCELVNDDLAKYDFEELKKTIDYQFYINKTRDLLDISWIELKHGSTNPTTKFDYFKGENDENN